MAQLSEEAFRFRFQRFQQLILAYGRGHPFTNFNEGVAAAWEGYKPRLRNHALELLAAPKWSEADVGTGRILGRTIASIEIQDARANQTNNLVFWQNRFGHANREHRAFLEAVPGTGRCREIEALLFGLYRGDADEGDTFDLLSQATGGKYPLLAYLYFLKDDGRFMPIQPTTFDRAFAALGIPLVTLRHCSWDNYRQFNEALLEVRSALSLMPGLANVRLIDAHSFCWLLEKLPHPENPPKSARQDSGRVFGALERTVHRMRDSIENTVRNSNGQTVLRTVKNKELRMTSMQLEQLLLRLMNLQQNRCALTGIRLHLDEPGADGALAASADRIDSDGHYEEGNIQIVCRFINGWKGSTGDEEFKRLLALVREPAG